MIQREESSALGMEVIFDRDLKKRYSVTRTWDQKKQRATIIMFNPVHVVPKPFAVGVAISAMGKFVLEDDRYGSLEVVNLFAATGENKKSPKARTGYLIAPISSTSKKQLPTIKPLQLFWHGETSGQ